MFKKTLDSIPVISLLFIVFVTYANTIDDLDLWWHLKSGKYIYETKTVPDKDDFSFTSYISEDIRSIGKKNLSPSELPSDENNLFWSSSFMKRNWLSQIIFYITYLTSGFTGIGILKSAIFVITYLLIYVIMLKMGAGRLSSILVLCLVAVIGVYFNYTRPQLFSFLSFSLMLYILNDFKKEGKSFYFLPVLMLFWANLHGGFVLGIIILISFISSEFFKYLLSNVFGISGISSMTKGRIKTLSLYICISVFICLINQADYKTFMFPLIIKNSIFASVEEYHRPMLYEYFEYWLMLALLIIFIIISGLRKRLDISDLIIALVLITASLKSNKYIIYFAIGTAVFLSSSISDIGTCLKDNALCKRFFDRTGFARINIRGGLSLLLAAASLILSIRIASSSTVLEFDIRDKRYPSGAVEFIQKNNPGGNMLNLFNWGGYLVWHLYPDYRVFIYGRSLNETAFFHYNKIMSASIGSEQHVPLWKKLLTAYNINIILIPAVSQSGHIVPLLNELYVDTEWELLYADGKAMIFLKSTKDNQEIIHQYYLSKESINDEIIRECQTGIKETPATWGYYETLGFVYMKQNRLPDALNMFQKYLEMNPYNNNVRSYYDLLRRYTKKGN
ncbi:MAG: tetratricopeptide repeat protein [Nitrospirota bacterium]